jgi:hypothetical protein
MAEVDGEPESKQFRFGRESGREIISCDRMARDWLHRLRARLASLAPSIAHAIVSPMS